MRAHLLAPDWSVCRQVGLDYKSRLNWSKQRLASFWRLTSLIHMCENAMKVSKVGGIYFKSGIGGGERGGGGGGGGGRQGGG